MTFLMISKSGLDTLMEQKLLCFLQNYFLLLTAFSVFPTKSASYLNGWELLIVKSTLLIRASSLLNFHKLPDVYSNYYYIQSNWI